jgi:serine/threonine protein kinase
MLPPTVALSIGTRLGGYEILRLIGRGGMGEVYRARDTKLGRDVALKILPETDANDSDLVRRFRREAQILASLNHPNIAAIYGLEESGATVFLVLELVEGGTLADRLTTGRLPIDDALMIASQIVVALEAAHDKGVIHRDLKPANIMVARDSHVKVLDFGLAKLADISAEPWRQPDPGNSTTASGTIAGMLLGTAGYMSPEQTRGRSVDERTDIWAFGCVLYEMLTGRMAFSGTTPADCIAAILEREPGWSALPDATPPYVDRVLRGCLEKDVRRRWRDIGDVRVQLDSDLKSESTSARVRSRRPIRAAILLTLVISGVATAYFVRQELAWVIHRSPGADSRTQDSSGGSATVRILEAKPTPGAAFSRAELAQGVRVHVALEHTVKTAPRQATPSLSLLAQYRCPAPSKATASCWETIDTRKASLEPMQLAVEGSVYLRHVIDGHITLRVTVVFPDPKGEFTLVGSNLIEYVVRD